MQRDLKIEADDYIAALKMQRNASQDECALLAARIEQLEKQLKAHEAHQPPNSGG